MPSSLYSRQVQADLNAKEQRDHQERFDGFVGHLRNSPDAMDHYSPEAARTKSGSYLKVNYLGRSRIAMQTLLGLP